jgi:hypothetical protein
MDRHQAVPSAARHGQCPASVRSRPHGRERCEQHRGTARAARTAGTDRSKPDGKYDAWTAWLGRQTLVVRLLVLTATALIVLATLYLLNAFGMIAGWVGLGHWTWLRSPLFG